MLAPVTAKIHLVRFDLLAHPVDRGRSLTRAALEKFPQTLGIVIPPFLIFVFGSLVQLRILIGFESAEALTLLGHLLEEEKEAHAVRKTQDVYPEETDEGPHLVDLRDLALEDVDGNEDLHGGVGNEVYRVDYQEDGDPPDNDALFVAQAGQSPGLRGLHVLLIGHHISQLLNSHLLLLHKEAEEGPLKVHQDDPHQGCEDFCQESHHLEAGLPVGLVDLGGFVNLQGEREAQEEVEKAPDPLHPLELFVELGVVLAGDLEFDHLHLVGVE